MSIFIRKKMSGGKLYAQVVQSERIDNERVKQIYIGSLGTINDLIKKLEGMIKWIFKK